MRLIHLTAEQLEQAALHRAPGFVAAVQRLARRKGEIYVIEPALWQQLTLEHLPARPRPDTEPTALDLATRAAFAAWRAGRAAATGERVLVDADTYATRTAACTACEYWDGTARLGLGTCKHHACGCTKLKRWLTTERCPLAKWPT